MIFTGFKRPLEDDDVWKSREKYKAENVNKIIEAEWDKEMQKMYRLVYILIVRNFICANIFANFLIHFVKK